MARAPVAGAGIARALARTTGFCTRTCDPNNDDCPDRMACTEYWAFYDQTHSLQPFYMCE